MKKISILLIMIFLFVLVYAQEPNLLVVNLGVYKNDTVVLNQLELTFGSPTVIQPQEGNYSLLILDKDGLVLYRRNIKLDFIVLTDPPMPVDHNTVYDKIEYLNIMHTIQLYHGDKLIFTEKLVFCNNNNICEPKIGENEYNCPEDCSVACRDQNYECTINDIPCCPGLKEVSLAYEDEEGKCVAPVPCGSICVPCGDGICEGTRFENKCNCPEDCKKPGKFPWVYLVIGMIIIVVVVILFLKRRSSKTEMDWEGVYKKWK